MSRPSSIILVRRTRAVSVLTVLFVGLLGLAVAVLFKDLRLTVLIVMTSLGLAAILTFLISVSKRLDAIQAQVEVVGATTRDQIADGLRRMNEATELFGAVEASAMQRDDVVNLIRNSTRVPVDYPIIARLGQAEISRVSRFLGELGRGGDAVYEGEDRDWLLSLARNVEHSIEATSLTTVDAGGRGFVDNGLWSSELGFRLIELQQSAVDRGVIVRRVFIMDRPDLAQDPGFRDLVRWHKQTGAALRVLDPSNMVGSPLNALFDFTIFDGSVSYEAQAQSRITPIGSPVTVSTRLVINPTRVRERRQRFEDLWRRADDLPTDF